MSNTHVVPLLAEYMDGTLAAPARERVRSHLIFCNPCRLTLTEYQENAQRLKAHRPTTVAPTDFEETVQKAQAAAPEPEKLVQMMKTPLPWRKVVPLLVVGGLGIWLFIFSLKPSAPATPEKAPAPKVVHHPVTEPEVNPSTPVAAVHLEPAPVAKVEIPVPAAQPVLAVSTRTVVPKTVPAAVPARVVESTPTSQAVFSDVQAPTSGIETPLEVVASDRRNWNRIWNRYQRNQGDKQPLPEVDFSANEVILVAGGSRPTAGYLVQIQKINITIWEGNPARVVIYRVNPPPSDSLNATVFTYPASYRVVPKFDGPTFFRKNE